MADSTGKGNYTGSIAVTGSNPAYQQKHIYDLAGNVAELTMEACATSTRVNRGGYFYDTGIYSPASNRNNHDPDGSFSLLRFSSSFIFVTLSP